MRSLRVVRQDRGFALLEVAVVLFVLTLAAAFIIPRVQESRRTRRADAVVADLRAFAAAFQSYVAEHGDWPPGPSPAAVPPPGMEKRLATSNWTRPTPVGGYYAWSPNSPHRGERYRAAIVIRSAHGQKLTDDRRDLLAIDRKIDNGTLGTGPFHLGYRDEPVYVLEP